MAPENARKVYKAGCEEDGGSGQDNRKDGQGEMEHMSDTDMVDLRPLV
jgi:hypothetical protein